MIQIGGATRAAALNSTSRMMTIVGDNGYNNYSNIAWSENKVSWYATDGYGGYSAAAAQLNASGSEYQYLALG